MSRECRGSQLSLAIREVAHTSPAIERRRKPRLPPRFRWPRSWGRGAALEILPPSVGSLEDTRTTPTGRSAATATTPPPFLRDNPHPFFRPGLAPPQLRDILPSCTSLAYPITRFGNEGLRGNKTRLSAAICSRYKQQPTANYRERASAVLGPSSTAGGRPNLTSPHRILRRGSTVVVSSTSRPRRASLH